MIGKLPASHGVMKQNKPTIVGGDYMVILHRIKPLDLIYIRIMVPLDKYYLTLKPITDLLESPNTVFLGVRSKPKIPQMIYNIIFGDTGIPVINKTFIHFFGRREWSIAIFYYAGM